jgi:REP element-mobilizing transposase RayT
MARKPRIQFPNAIYHITTRGDGRRKLFNDQNHYERFTEGLEAEVLRSGWDVISYCWMPNHIHLLVQTPEPNLSNGIQHWLSGYANWYAKRNRRTGHLYQGRFKAFQVEDMSYFWPLSRYIHLNPCVGKRPLVERPQDWQHSSYRSCIYKRDACDWLAKDLLMNSWRSEFGGTSAAGYRRYVERGLDLGENPLEQANEGWVLGSDKFLHRLVAKTKATGRLARVAKRGQGLSPQMVIDVVARSNRCTASDYQLSHSKARGRALSALLCRELTNVSLAELSKLLGLGYPSSAANLVRKAKKQITDDKNAEKRYRALKTKLAKTKK